MSFEIVDALTRAAGEPNEDRYGHAATLAWVIDGSTDLVDAPHVDPVSDAAWLAGQAAVILTQLAGEPERPLLDLPALVNERLAEAYRRSARHRPAERWAHPSAAALLARARNGMLEWAQLGDCALIAQTGTGGLVSIGVGGVDAGDKSTAAEVARIQAAHDVRSEAERKAQLWPRLRIERAARLNQLADSGYAAFSISEPPASLIAHGRIATRSGTHALLATDGLIRLIDLYGRYDARTLLDTAISDGLAPLFDNLREIESDDAECRAHPRIKRSDDATGMLLRIL